MLGWSEFKIFIITVPPYQQIDGDGRTVRCEMPPGLSSKFPSYNRVLYLSAWLGR